MTPSIKSVLSFSAAFVFGLGIFSSSHCEAQFYGPAYGPVYYAPQPVVIPPRPLPTPVYVAPAPVMVTPPVIISPTPVVVQPPVVQTTFYAPAPVVAAPVVTSGYYRQRSNYGLFGQWNDRVYSASPYGGGYQHTRVGWNGVHVHGRAW